MKMHVEYPTRIPHGGMYHIQDPMTKIWVRGTDYGMFVANLRKTRLANGFPIGQGFEDEVEQLVCRNYSAECINLDPAFPRKRSLTLADIIRGTGVMLRQLATGNKLVEPKEAERRAAICAECPFNLPFAKPCTGMCPELSSIVNWITRHQGTTQDSRLHACNVCGCELQAAVWVPLENQCAGLSDEQKAQFRNVPTNCWKICD